jgi:enoyl-CoA hydratase
MSFPVLLTDEPAPHVRRITLNRPEKRNALNHALRGGTIHALQEADQDAEVGLAALLRRKAACTRVSST